MIYSQNKSARTVADVWANGSKLHIQYSDGTGKDMDMPPATSIHIPYRRGVEAGYLDLNGASRNPSNGGYGVLTGTFHSNEGYTKSWELDGWHR